MKTWLLVSALLFAAGFGWSLTAVIVEGLGSLINVFLFGGFWAFCAYFYLKEEK